MSIWGVGDTGLGAQPAAFGAAEGNPSGYGGSNAKPPDGMVRSEVVLGLIVIAVLFMLITGVIALRASGEIVI